jgi:type II secretion system protein H
MGTVHNTAAAQNRSLGVHRGCRGPKHRRLPFVRTQSAFTLMELMLVLALIAIMAAMIVPEMKGSMEDALLRSSARKMVDLFNITYSRAVSLNQQHRIHLNPASGQYFVERQNDDLEDPRPFIPITDQNEFRGQIDSRIAVEIRPTPQEISNEQILEEQPKAQFASEGINFYADGTADGCEIVLRDRMGVELILQLSAITANVHIAERPTD